MVDVIANPDHIPVWDAAARGEPVDRDTFFRGYQATVDWPSCRFFEDQHGRIVDSPAAFASADDPRDSRDRSAGWRSQTDAREPSEDDRRFDPVAYEDAGLVAFTSFS